MILTGGVVVSSLDPLFVDPDGTVAERWSGRRIAISR